MIEFFYLYFIGIPLIFQKRSELVSHQAALVTIVIGLFIAFLPSAPAGSLIQPDYFGLFFAYLITFFALIFFIFTYGRITGLRAYTILLMILGSILVVFAADLFTLFVAWELVSFVSYFIVIRRVQATFEGVIKYMVTSALGAGCILFAIALTIAFTGSSSLSALSNLYGGLRIIVFILLFSGFGVRMTTFPFNLWVPDLYQSSDFLVTSIFAAVLTKLGVYTMARTLAGTELALPMVAILAVITMTLANLSALTQRDIKRLLAYSSIAHMSYILLGISTSLSAATISGITGSLFHSFNHLICMTLAFFAVGAAGQTELSKLAGLYRKSRFLGLSLVTCFFSLAGIPGLNIFAGEFLIITGTIESGYLWFAVAMVLNQLIALAYYLKLVKIIAIDTPSGVKFRKSHNHTMILIILFLTFLVFYLGLFPGPALSSAERAAMSLMAYAQS
jgi:formate hydrogenlyase subunit 3/multisubunit Na+/H+ antiporter MnhD subunit